MAFFSKDNAREVHQCQSLNLGLYMFLENIVPSYSLHAEEQFSGALPWIEEKNSGDSISFCDESSFEMTPMISRSQMEYQVKASNQAPDFEAHITMNNKFDLDIPYGGRDSPLINMSSSEFKEWLKVNRASCSVEYLEGLKAARRRCNNRRYKEKERCEAKGYAAAVQAELDAAHANVLAMQAAQGRTYSRSIALWQESAFLDAQSHF